MFLFIIILAMKEHNDSEIIDTNKVDDKIYEEEEIEETPKKRGRPGGRKKGKHFNILYFYNIGI